MVRSINVEEIKMKLNDIDYLKSLIMKKHGDDGTGRYVRPEEWNQLMMDIGYACNMTRVNGLDMPFSKDNFKYFLDGTVSKLFKESVCSASDNSFVRAYEGDKISSLAKLPNEVTTVIFSQDDLIDALENSMNFAIYFICKTGSFETATVVANKFAQRSFELDKLYHEELIRLKRNESKLQNLSLDRLNKEIERDDFLELREPLVEVIHNQNDKITELKNRRMICTKYAREALNEAGSHIAQRYSSKHSSQDNTTALKR